ncbi:MAG: hypothetical protein JNL95_12295 [Chitinophagales bacterium]|nr:hypothetical protein [Chitinophagales bacterium]
MKSIRLFLPIALSGLFFVLKAQERCNCKQPIIYPTYGKYKDLYYSDFKNDTLVTSDGTELYFILSKNDCKGKATIILYDFENRKKAEFHYKDGIRLLLRQRVEIDPVTLDEAMSIQEYYEAIPNGYWIYYKEDGSIEKKDNYNFKIRSN